MLSKKERYLMTLLYRNGSARGGWLVEQAEHLALVRQKYPALTGEELGRLLACLEMDGYVDTVQSERREVSYYCVTLHVKGMAFERELLNERRSLRFKILMTVVTAVLGFLLTRLLVSLF